MARTAAAERKDEETPEPSSTPEPEKLGLGVPQAASLPDTFTFSISRNVPIPEKVRKTPTTAHTFVAEFDRMGHNDSMFIPSAYWLKRGVKPENATKGQWQKQTISGLFAAWRKKDESRSKLRLVTVARDVNEDQEFPAFAGVRAWVVDTTR